MNLSYLKYAVEVEKTGSITKAAQNYYMNQPHLSKSVILDVPSLTVPAGE